MFLCWLRGGCEALVVGLFAPPALLPNLPLPQVWQPVLIQYLAPGSRSSWTLYELFPELSALLAVSARFVTKSRFLSPGRPPARSHKVTFSRAPPPQPQPKSHKVTFSQAPAVTKSRFSGPSLVHQVTFARALPPTPARSHSHVLQALPPTPARP